MDARIGSCMIGLILGLLSGMIITEKFMYPAMYEKIQLMDQLRTKGLHLTLSPQMDVWMWDEKSHTSFRLDGVVLRRMSKEMK